MSTDNNAKSTEADQPAFPLQPTFNNEGQICNERYAFEGLTKREYFAAMAKTPDFILEQELSLWRGDRNHLPQVGSIDYIKMMRAIADIDSAYAIFKADSILKQLAQ